MKHRLRENNSKTYTRKETRSEMELRLMKYTLGKGTQAQKIYARKWKNTGSEKHAWKGNAGTEKHTRKGNTGSENIHWEMEHSLRKCTLGNETQA